MVGHEPGNLVKSLGALKPKDKSPVSARVLNNWITQAQDLLGTAGGRLGWLVAATVVSGALQRTTDESGSPLFLLKGGTMLQYRLSRMSRTTQDIDGLIRGDIDRFLEDLDLTLKESWGPLTFSRSEIQTINVPHKVVKPRRFDISVLLNGIPWRRVQVEIAPDEGRAGSLPERIIAPSLAGFGLPSPDQLAGLALSYQIAQKIHAVTDPHDPPASVNDRARDVVDLLLLRDLTVATGHPSLAEIRNATEDIFRTRAEDAEATGGAPRNWPTRLRAYPHWKTDYRAAAESASLSIPLGDAVEQVNAWLEQIATA